MTEVYQLVICPMHGVVHRDTVLCYLCERRNQDFPQMNLTEYDRLAREEE